jgi:predicted dehydrogenase
VAKNIRIGFIGAGGIARSHAEGHAKIADCELVGVTDVHAPAAEKMAADFGGKSYGSAAEMLKESAPDAVFIFTPPFARGEGERAVLAAKIPFFIEKPLANDKGLMAEIAAEVQKQNLLTSTGYMTRYRKSVARAKEIVKEDPAILGYGGWWGGSPGNHPWWTDMSKSGGQFHEQATHTVDLARYLFGEAVEVYAAGAHGFNKGIPNYTMDDAVTVVIKFAGGGIANLMASCSSNAGGGIILNISCLNHNIKFNEWRHDVLIESKGGNTEGIRGENNIFEIEDAVFIEAVRSGDRSGIKSDYADGMKSALLSLAANESVKSGKPVSL